MNNSNKAGELIISDYTESYTDNEIYDRSYTNKNGNEITQTGNYKFEGAQKLHISGVGSIEFISNNTVSSSYHNISKLTESELSYSFTNGSEKHQFRLSRK